MKRTYYIKTMILLGASFLAASCSIKEDRSPCPCWLDMDITSCAEHSNEVTLAAWNNDNLFKETVSVAEHSDVYERPVSKGMVSTAAFCGLSESSLSGSRIIIPEGMQADRLKAHAAVVDCTGESARDIVELYRQFATVYLSIKSQEQRVNPYEAHISGEICGIDLRGLSPVEGGFSFSPEKDSEGKWTFRLPRQKEDSKLTLSMLFGGEVADQMPLSEWINDSGYSWQDRDLKDIYIGVDYAAGKVTVVIEGWGEGDTYDIRL